MTLRRLCAPLLGLLLCGALALLSERGQIIPPDGGAGTEIRFSATDLNDADIPRKLRQVHPAFKNIEGWVSAVGAAVGSADFDGSGQYNDYCLVDPRTDTVTVGEVADSGTPEARTELVPAVDSPAPSAPMGCVPADMDADGREDVLVYYWGRSPVIFYSDAQGSFRPTELVNPVELWNSTTANVLDVDGDGRLDVAAGNYFPDGARVLDPEAVDDDRMAMQAGMARAHNAGTNRLFLQSEAGGFRDSSDALPKDSAQSWTLAYGAQDLTGDLLPELYVANDFGPDQLLVNHSTPGRAKFSEAADRREITEAKSSNLGNDSFKGMGVAFLQLGDMSYPSMAVSNITQTFGLLESNFLYVPKGDPAAALRDGKSNYVQRSEEYNMSRSGWAWDIRAADFNNDGQEELVQATGFVAGTKNRWPELQELAMANDQLLPSGRTWFNMRAGDDISGSNRNVLWCLQGNRRFSDCAPTAGIDSAAPTRSFATTDVDGDGRVDLLEANQWGASRLLRNTSDIAPALTIRPVVSGGAGTERAAIGARFSVAAGDRNHIRQLYPANGHTGVSSSELTFPARASGEEYTITVDWRTTHGVLRNKTFTLPADSRRVTVVLDDDGEVQVR